MLSVGDYRVPKKSTIPFWLKLQGQSLAGLSELFVKAGLAVERLILHLSQDLTQKVAFWETRRCR